jgi:hypothetical protein
VKISKDDIFTGLFLLAALIFDYIMVGWKGPVIIVSGWAIGYFIFVKKHEN